MTHLIYFLVCGLVIFFGAEKIRKYDLVFYFVSLALVLETSYRMYLSFSNYEVTYPFGLSNLMMAIDKGILPTVIFIWVMFAGAFLNHWKMRKRIMICRGELSIIASLLILPHIVYYFMDFLAKSGHLAKLTGLGLWGVLVGAIAGIVAGLIMLPLYITSYKNIRKRLGGKQWKALQEYAYVFYGLVYLHILAEYFAKGAELRNHSAMLFYTVCFLTYLFMRVSKWRTMKRKRRV